ncbi:ATP-binding protein [Niallia oryzisoli]|uniref:histidine kinase n=1 Tax=Niallia oryzisoli TaxID=1737571 RepID=A0ABZ2CJ50_9BACI
MNNRERMIELLTGVQSSKRNYYTELKKTVGELQKKNIQLEIINEVMKGFNVEMSMDDLLMNVLEKLRKIFPIERISLSMIEGKDLILTNVYPSNSFVLKPGTELPRDRSLYWNVMRSGKPLLLNKNPQDKGQPWFEEKLLTEMGLESFFLVPLKRKGHVTGVLSLGSKENLESYWADLSFFQQLSDQLAVCIENSHLYKEVLETKMKWEKTFQAVPDAIIIIGLNRMILQANEAAQQYFATKGSLIGQQVDELLFSQEENHPFQEKLLELQTSSDVLHIGHKIYECHCYPIFYDSNLHFASILYMEDVTAKRRIEGQLIQSGKLAAIGEMAAGVAHELNNPLTAIMGNAQLLLRKTDSTDRNYQLLESVYECGKRSKQIIQNLLTFSRQDEFLFEFCSVNEAVGQALSLIGNQLAKQGIQVETKLDDSLPHVEGSCQQIGQIILNLLLNAKDALEESDRNEKKVLIQTALDQRTHTIVLKVTDNGCGIEEDVLSEIFHPFYTTKNATKGHGLGLSVSIGIAQSHGGTLQAESKPGEGSTFLLTLPIPGDENNHDEGKL